MLCNAALTQGRQCDISRSRIHRHAIDAMGDQMNPVKQPVDLHESQLSNPIFQPLIKLVREHRAVVTIPIALEALLRIDLPFGS